jgi:hypothetical protein
MAPLEVRRANRHRVRWLARARPITESKWRAGQVLNLSAAGVLLQLEEGFEIGERVEVEIDFRTQPQSKTVVTGVGHVVRELRGDPYTTAIHFDLGCRPAPRATEQAERGARL